MTNDTEQKQPDWTNLPEGMATESLWNCLHDGSLLDVNSDALERTLKLTFDVDYVRDFNKLPDAVTFDLFFSGVQSVRSLQYRVWPGAAPDIQVGTPPEEQSRLVAQYQSKWREESEDWQTFENIVKLNTNDSPEVADANLAMGTSGIALRLGLLMPDESYRDVFVRAESLEISLSNGQHLTLQAFLALGEGYWKAFAARRPENESD
jgi:hypothetical protein